MKTKTFWSVEYAMMGRGGTNTAWFDSEKSAEDFWQRTDHSDSPVRHNYRNPEKIEDAERLVAEMKYYDARR